MLMASREIHHLRDLGFRDFVAEHPDHRNAFLMHRKHDLEGFGMSHAKEPFKDMNNEFHRCVIVIQKKNFVERRAFRLGTRFEGHTKIAIIAITGGHMKRL